MKMFVIFLAFIGVMFMVIGGVFMMIGSGTTGLGVLLLGLVLWVASCVAAMRIKRGEGHE